jgi:hypothetical protein
MNATTLTTLDKVRRLLTFATGEPYGDGETVTDVITGYAEPGYGSDDSIVVLGNWNTKRYAHDGEPPLTAEETLPARLADALDRVGAEVEWLDEWAQCQECYRAIRVVENSYHWKPSYVWLDDCTQVCTDCAIGMGIDALESYVNDPTKAVTWCEPLHLESLGFVKWEPGNEHTYESGWHEGMDDDPKAILASIRRTVPAPTELTPAEGDVIFLLDESSQFYIRFSAYVREHTDEDEGE